VSTACPLDVHLQLLEQLLQLLLLPADHAVLHVHLASQLGVRLLQQMHLASLRLLPRHQRLGAPRLLTRPLLEPLARAALVKRRRRRCCEVAPQRCHRLLRLLLRRRSPAMLLRELRAARLELSRRDRRRRLRLFRLARRLRALQLLRQ
jgi:hypothetical protein